MRVLFSICTSLVFSTSLTAFAQEFPVKTLQADAIICFDYSDWKDMVAASIDQDNAAAARLVSSGACRVIPKSTKVAYLDKAAGDLGALIQMPSGKGAYTADAFLK